jgi:large subunit ribosomal protein MRP49
MTVNRGQDQAGPATLSIHYAHPTQLSDMSSSSQTAAPAETSNSTATQTTSTTSSAPSTDRVETIDMKWKQSDYILDKFLSMTGARVVQPTREELEEIEEIKQKRADGAKAAEKNLKIKNDKKREQALIAQARAEVVTADEMG